MLQAPARKSAKVDLAWTISFEILKLIQQKDNLLEAKKLHSAQSSLQSSIERSEQQIQFVSQKLF